MTTQWLPISASLLLVALTTGCSAMHGDPKHPTMNPHPVKRYEVIATADAPGPWDAVKGKVFFDVVNEGCVPRDSLTGGQDMPNVAHDIEMTRLDGKTWKGYFYRDALQDADYFGLGKCHWNATGVAAAFTVQQVKFNTSFLLKDFTGAPQTAYFRKSDFEKSLSRDPLLVKFGPADLASSDPKVIESRDAFFSIRVSVRETPQ